MIERKRWTDNDVIMLKEKIALGKTCREIAEILGRTTKSVQHRFNQLELEKPSLKVGDIINRLTIEELYQKKDGNGLKTYAKCKCECGNIINARLTSIQQEQTKSCGCLKAELASERTKKRNYKHGMGNLHDRLYRIWCAMKNRCSNPNNSAYKDYGGRGISVCDEWIDDFHCFFQWSILNGYLEYLTIDRKDVNGNYEPLNCQWATKKEQSANRRNVIRINAVMITAFGETKSITQWIKDERCKAKNTATIGYRIGTGWSPEDAISTPSQRELKAKRCRMSGLPQCGEQLPGCVDPPCEPARYINESTRL